MADTMKVNVYADNWFVMYINGNLRAIVQTGEITARRQCA